MSHKFDLISFPIKVGWDTRIQATGGTNTCLSMETSSTGTTGEPLNPRSSPSDACGTCSGIRRGAISPPRLPQPQRLDLDQPLLQLLHPPHLIPTPTLNLTPLQNLNPNLNSTPRSSPPDFRMMNAECPALLSWILSLKTIWSCSFVN